MSTLNRPDQQLEEAPNINPQTQISDVPNYLKVLMTTMAAMALSTAPGVARAEDAPTKPTVAADTKSPVEPAADVTPQTVPLPESATPTEPAAVEADDPKKCGDKPCYLHQAHFKYLQDEIAALSERVAELEGGKKEEIEALNKQIAELGVELKKVDEEDRGNTAVHRKILEEQLVKLNKSLEDLKKKVLAELVKMNKEKAVPEWAGWHGGVDFAAQYGLLTGKNAATYAPLEVMAYIRWMAKNELGLESGMGGGAWLTEGQRGPVAPPMLSGYLAGVAGGENWDFTLGPRLHALHTPQKGGAALHVADIAAGVGYNKGGFRVSAGVAAPLQASHARFGGVPIWLRLGYYK